jgi:hypothetical protein
VQSSPLGTQCWLRACDCRCAVASQVPLPLRSLVMGAFRAVSDSAQALPVLRCATRQLHGQESHPQYTFRCVSWQYSSAVAGRPGASRGSTYSLWPGVHL